MRVRVVLTRQAQFGNSRACKLKSFPDLGPGLFLRKYQTMGAGTNCGSNFGKPGYKLFLRTAYCVQFEHTR